MYTRLPMVVLLAAVAASAQVAEISVSGGQTLFRNGTLGAAPPGDPGDYQFMDRFRLGARLTLNTREYIGHEMVYMYTPTKIRIGNDTTSDLKVSSHVYGYNFLLYGTKEGATVRPFITGGGHINTFYPPGSSVSYGNGTTRVGINYGAGVKFKLNHMFALRFDLRDYATMKPFDFQFKNGLLHQIEASAGLALYF